MSFETPQALASELKLTTEHDGNIYRQHIEPMLKNLTTKKASGKYDREKAIKLFMYLAEAGARSYAKTFGQSEHEWHTIFPTSVRRLAAVAWRDEFEQMYKEGQYDSFIPKKYQKTPASDKEYQAGAAHAQLVAQNAPKSAIEYILLVGEVFPQAHRHIPEISHLPTPKNHRKPAFKRGFLDMLRNIQDAMEGN
jgi:hypothetical protein